MAQGRRQWQEFVEELRERAGSEPSSPMFRVRLGNALERIGETNAALAEYRAAAEGFLRTGFARHARSVYRMILDRAPNDKDARRGYAMALRDTYEENEGIDLSVPSMPPPENGSTESEPPAATEEEYWDSVKGQDPGTLFEATGEDFAMVRGSTTSPTPPAQSVSPPPPPTATTAPPPPATTSAAPLARTAETVETVPSSVADRRRAPRVPWDVETHVSNGKTIYVGHSTSLSATGVFVEGLTSIELGDLVDITFVNETEGWKGSGRGQLARVVDPESESGGSGVALLWVDPPTELWMIRHIESALGRTTPPPDAEDVPEVEAQAGRNAPRVPVIVPARVVSREFEAVGWSLDLSETGALLGVPQLFSKGELVKVTLWLDGHDEALVVDATIVESRRANTKRRSGVAVRFGNLTPETIEQINLAVRRSQATP